MNFDILEIISNTVKSEIEKYSKEISEELFQKYMDEFEDKIRSKRREVVLKACDGIHMHGEYDPGDMAAKITIKLENK